MGNYKGTGDQITKEAAGGRPLCSMRFPYSILYALPMGGPSGSGGVRTVFFDGPGRREAAVGHGKFSATAAPDVR
jgi:hypothetical protein